MHIRNCSYSSNLMVLSKECISRKAAVLSVNICTGNEEHWPQALRVAIVNLLALYCFNFFISVHVCSLPSIHVRYLAGASVQVRQMPHYNDMCWQGVDQYICSQSTCSDKVCIGFENQWLISPKK